MKIAEVMEVFGDDNYEKFCENLSKVWIESMDWNLKIEIPKKIKSVVVEVQNNIKGLQENLNTLSPWALIEVQTRLLAWKSFLSEYTSYYSVQTNFYTVYRRNLKSAISISLRKMTKDFEDSLNKKLTVSDTNNMSELMVSDENEKEFQYSFLADYLQSLSYDIWTAIKIIDNKLIEKRHERKLAESVQHT